MGAQGSALAPHQALAPGDLDLLKASLAKTTPPSSLPPAWQVLPAPALDRVKQGLGQGQARTQVEAGSLKKQHLSQFTSNGPMDQWRVIE